MNEKNNKKGEVYLKIYADGEEKHCIGALEGVDDARKYLRSMAQQLIQDYPNSEIKYEIIRHYHTGHINQETKITIS